MNQQQKRITVLIVILLAGWGLYFVWYRFQLVRMHALDYAALFLLASVGATCATVWRTTVKPGLFLFLPVGLLAGSVGGASLLLLNALLDRGTATAMPTTVVRAGCLTFRAFSYYWLAAPQQQLAEGPFRLLQFPQCGRVQEGDSVILQVKPGFFGRPWIASYREQTSEDLTAELLSRHRALVEQLRLRDSFTHKP
jgi:hypothetical protein